MIGRSLPPNHPDFTCLTHTSLDGFSVYFRGLQFFYRMKPIVFGRSFWRASVLPELIGQFGDIPLGGFVSEYVCSVPGLSFLVRLEGLLISLVGVLKGLSGVFMSRYVISLFVVCRSGKVSVGGKVMIFSGFLV
jgi:hypothetical protein